VLCLPRGIGRENHQNSSDGTLDPDEQLDISHQTLRRVLAQELLQRIRSCKPAFFEQLVVDVLVAMGYGGSLTDAGAAIGHSGDGGIDGVIKEDRLGLDTVYLQAKRWQGTVGQPAVREFAGSLEGFRARKGVLITTSKFSQDAHDYASRIEKRIVLIDGEQLVQLMIEFGVGIKEVHTYLVMDVDLDYFGGE
jgi:restriction system protein